MNRHIQTHTQAFTHSLIVPIIYVLPHSALPNQINCAFSRFPPMPQIQGNPKNCRFPRPHFAACPWRQSHELRIRQFHHVSDFAGVPPHRNNIISSEFTRREVLYYRPYRNNADNTFSVRIKQHKTVSHSKTCYLSNNYDHHPPPATSLHHVGLLFLLLLLLLTIFIRGSRKMRTASRFTCIQSVALSNSRKEGSLSIMSFPYCTE